MGVRLGGPYFGAVWNYSGGLLPSQVQYPRRNRRLRPDEGYILTGAPSPVMWKALIGKGPTLSKLRRSFLMRIFDLAGTRPYG